MEYMVRCFNEGQAESDVPREVEAGSAHQAGERICGGSLEYTGHLGDLRCEVWPSNNPKLRLLLYRARRASNPDTAQAQGTDHRRRRPPLSFA